jgi:hypothetical protein
MPSNNWTTEVTACLLAYIDHNIALDKQWNDGIVEAMKAQGYDRNNLSINAKFRNLAKKVINKSSKLATDGSACLDLDEEMKNAVESARVL